MKHFARILILFVILGVANSCKKAKIDVNFDLSIADLIFIIDSTSVTGPQELATVVIRAKLEEELKKQKSNASLDDIKSVTLKSANLEITDPTGQTFDIASSAEGFFSGGSLAKVRVVWKDVIPATGLTEIDLDVSSSDLAPYIKLNELTYSVNGNLTAPLTEKTTVRGKVVFKVEASVSPL